MKRRITACALLITISSAALTGCSEGIADEPVAEENAKLGIAAGRPAADTLSPNAQVVPIESGGYMVPYEAELPHFGVTYQMTPIPGGTFTMGSPPDEHGREEDEGPRFQVEVEPFWMGVHEVTFAEYRTYMDLYRPARDLREGDAPEVWKHADAVTLPTPVYVPDYRFAVGDAPEHPMVTMTHYAARQYTKYLSKLTGRFYRLPTEAEWEYAARAGTTTAWSFGDDDAELAQHAVYYESWRENVFVLEGYQPVGSLKPNPWGLYDMHGNVAEWVIDQYDADHYARFADAEQPVHYMDALNWPREPYPVVVRGGAWDHDPEDTRSASRWKSDSAWINQDVDLPPSPWWLADLYNDQMVGFRIVRPLHEPDEATKHRFWGSHGPNLPEQLQWDVEDRLWEGRGDAVRLTAELLERTLDHREDRSRE